MTNQTVQTVAPGHFQFEVPLCHPPESPDSHGLTQMHQEDLQGFVPFLLCIIRVAADSTGYRVKEFFQRISVTAVSIFQFQVTGIQIDCHIDDVIIFRYVPGPTCLHSFIGPCCNGQIMIISIRKSKPLRKRIYIRTLQRKLNDRCMGFDGMRFPSSS